MSKINPELLRSDVVKVDYPCFKIVKYDGLLPRLLCLIEEGAYSLIADKDGKSYVIKMIDLKPTNINTILKYFPIRVFLNKDKYVDIEGIEEYLQLEEIWTYL